MIAELPELGQLVEVRRRQWVVMDIQESSPALGKDAPKQNLLTLASIDEDALGEPVDRTFPVAIEFIVPSGFVEGR